MDRTVSRSGLGILEGSILGRQIELEEKAIQRGVERYYRLADEAIERGEGSSLKPAERFLVAWFNPLVLAIQAEQAEVRRGTPAKGRSIYGPVILSIDAPRAAVITMHEAVSRCLKYRRGELVSRLTYAIGASVIAELHMDLLKKNKRATIKDLDRRFKRLTSRRVNWWAKQNLDENLWNRKVCVHLGAILLHLLIEVASATGYKDPKAAFVHELTWHDNQKKGTVSLTLEAWEELERGHEFRKYLRPRYLPMIVTPYPWGEEDPGGYVRIRTPFLSKPTPSQNSALEEADLTDIHRCLNAVNATTWRIHPRILAVAQQLWDEGGGIVGIPPADNIELPPSPGASPSEKELKAWKSEAHEIHSKNAGLRSQRVEFAQKLQVARDFLEELNLAYPHQLDFRSRAYPIPVHLNHQSDDLSRGALMFARAVPTTDQGRDRIYIQTANCWGEDKLPLHERATWAKDNLEWITQCAKDPLNEDEWHKAEDPFQFLAAAMALVDPELAAHLPCQVDGTLNGYQHLTAAGRDEDAAGLVNLVDSNRPSDPYTDLLVEVGQRVQKDAAGGDKLACQVLPHISRATSKRNAMTSVYGLTRVGATQQVRDILRKTTLDREYLAKASHYISGLNLECIAGIFPRANRIMGWLMASVRVICKKYPRGTLGWTTPLGFPVVQPYRKYGTVRVRTILQDIIIGYRDDRVPLSPGKQRSGIVPNWVHSLDGTHMFMTADECHHTHDIPSAYIHDGYLAHAENLQTMDRTLREAFVKLHEYPLVLKLHEEWTLRYPQAALPPPPEPGKLDISSVLSSTYFFS